MTEIFKEAFKEEKDWCLFEDSLQVIALHLQHRSEDEAQYLTYYAFLLGRVALANGVFTRFEMIGIESILHKKCGLKREEAEVITAVLKKYSELSTSLCEVRVLEKFKSITTDAQKRDFLQSANAVVEADTVKQVELDEVNALKEALFAA